MIVDSHASHNLDVILFNSINFCAHGCLPPHATYKLQSLDHSVLKSFKTAFSEACARWIQNYSYLKITMDIAGCVNILFTNICRIGLGKSAFSCTGISPLNRRMFSDIDLFPSAGLDFSDDVYAETSRHDVTPISDCALVADPELSPAPTES
jgi:hypothetical protein